MFLAKFNMLSDKLMVRLEQMADISASDDDDGDETFRLDAVELKALFKIARNRTLLFAYCPGGADEDVLFINRRRQPDRLAKDARRESSGTKVAYGRLTVKGKVVTLACDRQVPALTRRLAKYLREKRVPMEIVIEGETDGG